MAQLGTFKKFADGSYEGMLRTLTLNVNFRLVSAAAIDENGDFTLIWSRRQPD